MTEDELNVEQLALEITEIARTTTDPATGQRLMQLVHRLLTRAGLPDDDDDAGGGEPPTRWLSEPFCEAA